MFPQFEENQQEAPDGQCRRALWGQRLRAAPSFRALSCTREPGTLRAATTPALCPSSQRWRLTPSAGPPMPAKCTGPGQPTGPRLDPK